MTENTKLARKTAKNAFWNYGTFALSKGVVFINTVILARLLDPQDFGLLAIGLLVIGLLDVLNDFGIAAAVIYKQDDPEYTANVAFIFNMFVGLLLTITGFLIAPGVANFFEEPRVTPILRVLSLSFVIISLGSIHEARLMKELKFKRRLIPEIAKSLSKGLISIPLALAGYGVWSLVWGQVIGALVASIAYWWALRWIPRLIFDISKTRSLLNYGVQMVLVGFLGYVHKNVDYVLVGKRLNSVQLGYYSLAFRLPELIIINLVIMISQATFPSYAKLQNDIPSLRQGFLATLRVVTLLTMPVGLGIFVISPEFVTVFYTERWSPAIPVMQVLSLYAVIYSLSYNCGDIYKAIGRPGILNKLAIIKLVVTVPVLYFAASRNIYYVALGQLFTTVILTWLRLAMANSVLDNSFGAIWQAIRPATICGGLMVAGTWLLRTQLDSIPALVRMLIVALAGVALYGGAFWLLYREILLETLRFLRKPKKSAPQPAA